MNSNNLKRLTRIVATLGPSSREEQMIASLVRAGVDVFRFNFSHGTHESHGQALKNVRKIAAQEQASISVLQDLGGPKLRIGFLEEDGVYLATGAEFNLVQELETGDERQVGVYESESWFDQIQTGERVVLGDGKIVLKVTERLSGKLVCKVQSGNTLRSKAGLNFPDSDLNLGALTTKDWKDLEFGLENGVDAVALSFVQGPEDVIAVRQYISSHKHHPLLIAKIERPQAVERIDAILDAADGIMVARGDLGISVPIQLVPTIQKKLIHRARQQNKIVITATQMLESMTDAPMPTRAEVTDVANAVYDGTDAVMLSGETAVGHDPEGVVNMMSAILLEAESNAEYPRMDISDGSVEEAIAHTSRGLLEKLHARLIIIPLTSGSSAQRISRQLCPVPILAGVQNDIDASRMVFRRGVVPLVTAEQKSMLESLTTLCNFAEKNRLLVRGERAVVAGGFPLELAGITNFLRVITLGEHL